MPQSRGLDIKIMLTIQSDAPCHLNNGHGYNNQDNNNDLLAGQREIVKSIYDSENDVRTNLDSIGALITDGQSRLAHDVTNVSRDVLNTQHDLSKEIGDNKFFTSTGFSDVRQEVAQNRYQLLQVNNDLSKQIAHLSLENEKSEAKTREELIRGFGDVKLDACKNTSELARQIAECCCETQKSLLTQSASIRELDLKQSAQTRELALTIENNRLRDKCDNNERHSRNGDIEIAITNVLRNLNKA